MFMVGGCEFLSYVSMMNGARKLENGTLSLWCFFPLYFEPVLARTSTGFMMLDAFVTFMFAAI